MTTATNSGPDEVRFEDAPGPQNGQALTLEAFARHKRLPVDFLKDMGVVQLQGAIGFTYLDETGLEIAVKRRTKLKPAHDREVIHFWVRQPLSAYGRWRIHEAATRRVLILVEGESDALTLWHRGLPALGLPGANTAKTLLADHVVNVDTIYIQQEPDTGGDSFIKGVRERLAELKFEGKAYALKMPDGIKDVSDLHCQSDNADQFTIALETCIDNAEPVILPSVSSDDSAFIPIGIGDLCQQNPRLNRPVIEGLLRVGESMNVIASPKIGKSWFTLDLAYSVAFGSPWLAFPTHAGRVLLIDNELHRETMAHRSRVVAEARGVNIADANSRITTICLRGKLKNIFQIGEFLKTLRGGEYSLVIIDALYRTMPQGFDENNNADMARIYNAIDEYAAHLQAAFGLVHHSSKGSQTNKVVTDVGSGAGAQSRAIDCHLILRPHEEPGLVVLDANCRSFPPITPVCLRWVFPTFQVDGTADPKALAETGKRAKAEEVDAKLQAQEYKLLDALDTLSKGEAVGQIAVRQACGWNGGIFAPVVFRLKKKEIIETPKVMVPCGTGGKGHREADGIRRRTGTS